MLESALRDVAPQPDPTFERRLAERVANGFARPRRRRPPLMPALAAATVLVALATVGVVVLGGSKENTSVVKTTGVRHPEGAALAQAAPTARKVERAVRLTLAAPRGKLAGVASQVGEVTAAHGGYVLSSSVSTGDDGTRSGEFTLRIPSAQLEPALAGLSDLGDVRERDETSQDLTAPYGHVQDRLANALLERRATADRLRRASGDEAVRLRARLREVNAEVRALTAQLRSLRRRTAMSTVNVRLEEKAAPNHGGIAGGGPKAALEDAVAVLAGAVNVAIRLLPLALLVLLGWLALATARRRRREAALF